MNLKDVKVEIKFHFFKKDTSAKAKVFWLPFVRL